MPFYLHSQKFNDKPNTSVAEKIYLQLTSNVYALDEDIWFKAIVAEAKYHSNTIYSGLLNVDLIDPKGKVVSHKKVKLTEGIGYGTFELGNGFSEGVYLIRAYTQWNRNFGDDFIFKSYIDLVSASEKLNKNPIDAVTVIEKEPDHYLLKGRLLLPNEQKSTTLFIYQGKKKDSITVKRDKEKHYPFEYIVNGTANQIKIEVSNPDGIKHNETVLLKDTIDVRFFPESGYLVHGFQNKIGIKSLGADGKGIATQGVIFDNEGQRFAEFETNNLGMGFFFLQPDSSRTYHAKAFSPDDPSKTYTYPLPEVSSKGSILSVSQIADKVWIRVYSNVQADYAYIKIACRGIDYFLVEGPLRNGILTKRLSTEELPEGILVFTLLDKEKRPVAERLFFNQPDKASLNIALSTDKEVYKRREETKLDIRLPGNDKKETIADMSVAVINKKLWHQGKKDNIRSYFLLSSELRGNIEEPAYYFDENGMHRTKDLEALLLTQGWRRYKYPVQYNSPTFSRPQKGIEIQGRILSKHRKKPLDKITVNMLSFGNDVAYYNETTDSLGRFHFFPKQSYGKRMRVFLSAMDTLGNTNYDILTDTLKPPETDYEQSVRYRKPDVIVKAVKEVQKQRIRSNFMLGPSDDITELEEVVVSDRKLTSVQLKLYKKYGIPDVIISGEDIRRKEKKWSYGLYSILMFNYGDEIEIEKFSDGFMLAHIRGGKNEPTLLMVDGKLLREYEYEFVPYVSPDVIERVELIKYAKFFKSRYLDVFPETNPLEAPSLGHIISITTKEGKGFYSSGRTKPGTLTTSVELFSPVKEFYSPTYESPLAKHTPKTDLRSLIYWKPSTKIHTDKNESISFYNGDIEGAYIIIIEMITKDGRIGYKEKVYSVAEETP